MLLRAKQSHDFKMFIIAHQVVIIAPSIITDWHQQLAVKTEELAGAEAIPLACWNWVDLQRLALQREDKDTPTACLCIVLIG